MDLFHISSVSLSPVRTVTFHSSFPCFNKLLFMVILEMADSHSSCLLCHFVWAHCVIIYVFPDEGFDLFFLGGGLT